MNHINQEQEIVQKVHQTIQEHNMLVHTNRVVVAFSGGADSMLLLHILSQMKLPLLAAHVNHGLRGAEADHDEMVVKAFCEKFQIPLKILHTDVQKRANQLGIGVETCGRQVRYHFFEELAHLPTDKIATAHTLSDVCETVLHHLTRGTGLRGLCGIPAVRGSIIRPLLGITREEVEYYCEQHQLPFVTDSTNLEKNYTRNLLRLEVVPVLKTVNPSFEVAIQRFTKQCKEDSDYLENLAKQSLAKAKMKNGYCTAAFAEMPRPVRSRAILLAIAQVSNHTPTCVQVEQIQKAIQSKKGSVTVTGNIQFCVEGDFISLQTEKMNKAHWKIIVKSPEIILNDGRKIRLKQEIVNNYENDKNFHKLMFHNCIDYGTISDNATFRNRRDGDFFRPAGRGVTKSLKKLFNEAKIPPSKRDDIIILENEGQILWIQGFGPSAYGCVTANTTKMVSIFIEGADMKETNS